MNKYNDVTRQIMEEQILKKPAKKKVSISKEKEVRETIFSDIANIEVVFMLLFISYQIIDVLTSLSKIKDGQIRQNIFNSNFIYIITTSVLLHAVGAVIAAFYYKKKYNQDKKFIMATLVKPIIVLVFTLLLVIIRIYFINKYL